MSFDTPDTPVEAGTDDQALVISAADDTRELIIEALEAEGFQPLPVPADAGRGARFPDEPPALIVVDAGEDNEQWCARVRRRVRLEQVPLVVVSEQGGREVLHGLYGAGATAVFIKPVDSAFLRERFRSYGDTGRTLTGLQPNLMADARVLHAVPDMFFVLGADGTVREYLGGGDKDPLLSPSRLSQRKLAEVLPRDVAALFGRNIRRALSTREPCNFEFELGEPGANQRYEVRLLVQGRDRVMAILRNISEMAIRSRGGSSAADTLTGLPSRAAFLAHLDTMLADAKLRERGLVLLSVDLDRFTRINEALGRPVGDAILRVAGSRLERCLRDGDKMHHSGQDEPDPTTQLARIGGDEFVIVLRDIENRDDVAQIAGRVREAFVDPISYEGHKLEVTPSIGIAMFPLDGEKAEDLLANARAALDEARTHGDGSQEFYSNTMKYRSLQRLDVKNELKWAIEKDQLELRYLPRIDLETGRVAGLEALLRWEHPLRGLVALSEVIPLAEATGLMRPIGRWVLHNAAAHASYWRETWEALPPVSVNLSEQEFVHEELPQTIRAALDAAGLPAQGMEVELTESMLMRENKAAVILQKLKAVGVGIVIDDFGVGHSSLARLIQYPLKAIKIDRSFVEKCQADADQRSVCSAIIAMSRELGLTVIAEGVETVDQINFLRERGCHALQGFFFTEPLKADDVPAFLEAHLGITPDGAVVDLATIRSRFSLKSAS